MRRDRVRIVAALCALAALALVRTEAAPRAQNAERGTIRGRVRLTAASPANPPIRMGADPACSALYPNARPVQEFIVRSADGSLANVFVHLQGKFPDSPIPSDPVTLDQQGCVYRPHVIGMRAGQTLRVRNSDPTTHNVHSVSSRGNDINASRPQGTAPVEIVMPHEEMMLRITCDIHSWMNIYVGVVSHPYFAVTREDGRFEIRGVPAGHYTVEAWHERYGPLTATVDVRDSDTASVDFAYVGTEQAAPPTP